MEDRRPGNIKNQEKGSRVPQKTGRYRRDNSRPTLRQIGDGSSDCPRTFVELHSFIFGFTIDELVVISYAAIIYMEGLSLLHNQPASESPGLRISKSLFSYFGLGMYCWKRCRRSNACIKVTVIVAYAYVYSILRYIYTCST